MKKSTTTFAADYCRNGEVLYPAGTPVPTTAHTRELVDSGVAAAVSDDEAKPAGVRAPKGKVLQTSANKP